MIIKIGLICCLSLTSISCVNRSADIADINKQWSTKPLENKKIHQLHSNTGGKIGSNFDKLIFTKDYVTDTSQIKDYPSALVLFTDKWYTKKQSRKLCEKVIDLDSSKDKKPEEQFKTFFLINEITGDPDTLNCNSLKYLYNYKGAKELVYKILIPHREQLNWIQRTYEQSKIRGPYVVVYTDESRNPKLIIDLNQLGERSTEYFVQNWQSVINGIVDDGSLNDPKKYVGKQLISNSKLNELDKKDSEANKDLWKEGAYCIGIVSATAVSSAAGGAVTSTVVLALSQTLIDAKSKCKAIIDIAQS